MLYIKHLQPDLNIQSDSINANDSILSRAEDGFRDLVFEEQCKSRSLQHNLVSRALFSRKEREIWERSCLRPSFLKSASQL